MRRRLHKFKVLDSLVQLTQLTTTHHVLNMALALAAACARASDVRHEGTNFP